MPRVFKRLVKQVEDRKGFQAQGHSLTQRVIKCEEFLLELTHILATEGANRGPVGEALHELAEVVRSHVTEVLSGPAR